jgi:TPR repeat protein
MYDTGKGVSQDHVEAIRWGRKAADQGYAKAQFNLASMYYYGQGVPQDYSEAIRWHRKAADQGYAKALNGLPTCMTRAKEYRRTAPRLSAGTARPRTRVTRRLSPI